MFRVGKAPIQSSNAKPNAKPNAEPTTFEKVVGSALGLAFTAAVSKPAAPAADVPKGMKGFRCVRPSPFFSIDIDDSYPCPDATLPQVLRALVSALAANKCDFKVTIHPSAASEVHFGAITAITDMTRVDAVARVLETPPAAAGQPPALTLLLQRRRGDRMACERLFYHLARDTHLVPGLVEPALPSLGGADDDFDAFFGLAVPQPVEQPFMLNPADAAAAATPMVSQPRAVFVEMASSNFADDGEPV